MQNIIISPSILASDFSKLSDEIIKLNNSSCEWIHFDVMDGHFVPNLTFGAQLIKSVKQLTNKIFDVHLMMEYPLDYLDDFINAGSDYITIHIECEQVKQLGLKHCLNIIKSKGVKAGVALQPTTDLAKVLPFISYCDLILIMSVNAGFGGQTFIKDSLKKIAIISESSKDVIISVDGGINQETAKLCIDAGVNVLVSGSFIFNGDYEHQISLLR